MLIGELNIGYTGALGTICAIFVKLKFSYKSKTFKIRSLLKILKKYLRLRKEKVSQYKEEHYVNI